MSSHRTEQRTATITCSDQHCLGENFECDYLDSFRWYGASRYRCKLYGIDLKDDPDDETLAVRCCMCLSNSLAMDPG